MSGPWVRGLKPEGVCQCVYFGYLGEIKGTVGLFKNKTEVESISSKILLESSKVGLERNHPQVYVARVWGGLYLVTHPLPCPLHR